MSMKSAVDRMWSTPPGWWTISRWRSIMFLRCPSFSWASRCDHCTSVASSSSSIGIRASWSIMSPVGS